MAAHGATRKAAYQAACGLAAQGRRPTIVSIRQAMGGGGGQQAIQQGLHDWVDEAARRFQIPGIPDRIQSQVVTLWDAAVQTATELWQEEKSNFDQQVRGLKQQLDDMEAGRQAAERTADERRLQLQRSDDQLSRTRDDLERVSHEQATAQAALEAANEALILARQQVHEERRRREQAERVTEETRATLHGTQEVNASLKSDLEVAAARIDLLQESSDQAKTTARLAREDLERMNATNDALRGDLSVRDALIDELTVALKTEQNARELDGQHWMARLEEQRTAVQERKARETALNGEIRSLREEIAGLRAELAQARQATDEAKASERQAAEDLDRLSAEHRALRETEEHLRTELAEAQVALASQDGEPAPE